MSSTTKSRNAHAAGLAAARWGTNRPKSKPISIHLPAIDAMAAAGITDRPAWISALILKELGAPKHRNDNPKI